MGETNGKTIPAPKIKKIPVQTKIRAKVLKWPMSFRPLMKMKRNLNDSLTEVLLALRRLSIHLANSSQD